MMNRCWNVQEGYEDENEVWGEEERKEEEKKKNEVGDEEKERKRESGMTK